ncbi:hypothetical protein, partial [Enterococcus durans]|uniref:hypothetical protein n=1 Tax=Enterococcus durans TaxID=53345 RepID=UPI0039A56927
MKKLVSLSDRFPLSLKKYLGISDGETLVFLYGSILFDVGEVRQHLFCIKKYRKDTLKSFRINLANKFIGGFKM